HLIRDEDPRVDRPCAAARSGMNSATGPKSLWRLSSRPQPRRLGTTRQAGAYRLPTTLTVAVTQSLLASVSLMGSPDEAQAPSAAVLLPVLTIRAMTVVVRIWPGGMLLYSHEGVSALTPRSQISSTSSSP